MSSLQFQPYQMEFIHGERVRLAGRVQGRMVVPSEAVQKSLSEPILEGGACSGSQDAQIAPERAHVALQRVCNGYGSGEEPQEVTR